MAEGDTPGAPGAQPGQQPTTSAPSGQEPQTTPPANPTTPETPATEQGLTREQALDALEKARREAAKHRVDAKELEELRAFKQKQEAATLSETERLQKQVSDMQLAQTEAQRKAQERVIRAEVRAHAATVGVPPDLAARLIDYSEIEFDGDGEPTNIGKLLEKLIKQYPQLVPSSAAPAAPQPTSVGATPANPSRSGASSGVIDAAYVNSLTAAQYAALSPERRREIQQWVAQNSKK
ncbi:MAG TPA: hypothetical protein VKQ36_06730 [Ktedonobacterales bacterium]|nr:hypothetical protein [Ktedonobacterales bacterium]